MKKVLIITYYWIPSGGSGVQRWVKFCKYLRNYGWEPIIYTPENPEFPSVDYTFEKDIPIGVQIIKTPIWEPYSIYRKLTRKKTGNINAGFISEGGQHGWKEKLSVWVRGNFLLPDPRRFWIKPSVKFLRKHLKSHPVDAIITTGPPHSMHLIGLELKRYFPELKWISDFRDPWTSIFFYKDLRVNYFSNNLQKMYENKVVTSADAVVVVSEGMKTEFQQLNPRHIEVISNGFDKDDTLISNVVLDQKFTISHVGQITAKQNPYVLWKVLNKLCQQDSVFKNDLEIQLIGKVDYSVIESVKEFGLAHNCVKIPYLSHDLAIMKQQSSQLLLLLLINEPGNSCILTGKLFEYLASSRPVIGFGPSDGDAAKVLLKTNVGVMIDFDNELQAEEVLLSYYGKYKNGLLQVQSNSIHMYERKKLTGDMATLLNYLHYLN